MQGLQKTYRHLYQQQQGRWGTLQHLNWLRCFSQATKTNPEVKMCISHLHLLGCLCNQQNEILIFSGMNSSMEISLFPRCLQRELWPTEHGSAFRNLFFFFAYDFLYFPERVSQPDLGKRFSVFHCYFVLILYHYLGLIS